MKRMMFLLTVLLSAVPLTAWAQAAPSCLVKMSQAVPNVCKNVGSLFPDEFDVRRLTDWVDNLSRSFSGGACPGTQACAVQKGNTLCAWIVDTRTGQEGTEFSQSAGCYVSSQCDPARIFTLDAETFIPPDGNPCTGSTVCCIPQVKPPVQVTPGAGAPTTPGDSGQEIPEGYGLVNPLGPRTIPQIIGGIVQWMGGLAGSMFFLYLLWGGAQWMTARGSDEQAQTGRKKILAATAGIIVVLTAYLLVSAVIGLAPG